MGLATPRDDARANTLILALRDAKLEDVRLVSKGRFADQRQVIMVPATDEHRARQVLESRGLLQAERTDHAAQLPTNTFGTLDSLAVPEALLLGRLDRLQDALQAIPGVRQAEVVHEQEGVTLAILLACEQAMSTDLEQHARELAQAAFSRLETESIHIQVHTLPPYVPPATEGAEWEAGAGSARTAFPEGQRNFWVALGAAVMMGFLVLVQTMRLARRARGSPSAQTAHEGGPA